ncbi:MAG: FapA family protein, partial [Thiobacillus sp.]|nr:FapA family protein [Thiobacillus sp.]
AVKGQPVRVDKGVLVEQVVRIQSVNMASGNISFDGSVYVDGDVLTGMQVHVTGDIVVSGVVDGGILEAGGNIQVEGGIIAHARVRAAGSVSARFVENSQVYAGTAIAIDDMVLQSELQALNQIAVGIKSPQRGRLIGGSARAMMLVRTPMLGADVGSLTTVQVGVNPELEERFQNLVRLADKQKAEEENLQKLIQNLTKTGDKHDMLERAKASWQKALQDWAHSLHEKGELEKQLAMIEGARVEVSVGVAGAVSMAFGNKTHALRRSFDAGVFALADGRLVFTAASGQATDVD